MSKNNLLYLVIGIVVLFGLFYILKPKSTTTPSNTPTPSSESTTSAQMSNVKTFELVLKDKKVISGQETITVTEDDEVDIKVTADRDGEFHLHGYDKPIDLKKDEQGELKFTANLTGRFPIEFHESEENKYEVVALEVLPK